MCIRDRLGIGVFGHEVLVEEGEGLLAWGRGEADDVGVEIPVSYTHLRAHETVLDLVCRLLLEKKK